MSVSLKGAVEYTDQSLTAVPQSTTQPNNWTINVSDIRTVKVSNISLSASARDIQEFFGFSGDIKYVEMRRESETTQLAFITFKDPQGAETAFCLTGATIGELTISITPVEDYQLPPEAVSPTSKSALANPAVERAEDAVSTMLAKGFVLGKDALKKAKEFDDRHNLTSNASATVASIDQKMGLAEKLSTGTAVVSEKVREMDERYQVSEITKSALAAAEQKASTAGSALMSNRYVSAGASWFSNAFSAVAKAAEDVSVRTKEKVEKAEEDKRETLYRERTGIVSDYAQTELDDSAVEAQILPVNSSDSRLAII